MERSDSAGNRFKGILMPYIPYKTTCKIGHYAPKLLLPGREMQATLQHQHFHSGSGHLFAARRLDFPNEQAQCEADLPKDPRSWSRDHVQQWLDAMAVAHNIPEMDSQRARFLMNGKALCLMSQSMFVHRVPLGGKLLFKDFQLRLCAAMHAYP